MPRGGLRRGAGRPKGTGFYGEQTKPVRCPVGLLEAYWVWVDAYRQVKCVLTAARLLVAQLETNEKKNG